MDMGEAIGLISFVFLVASALLTLYMRRTTVVHVADFQVGIRFGKSGKCKILVPGSYRMGGGLDPITVVDMRPRPFLIERVNFQDALQGNCIVSIAAETVVSDPLLATNSLKNLFEDSLRAVRELLGPAAARQMIDADIQQREALAQALTSEINRELQTSGVVIQNLEITELLSRGRPAQSQAKAN